MTVALDGSTMRASAEAVRVLVSPMAYPTTNAWRRAVHDALRCLFRADQAMTILPAAGELVLSHDLDPDVLVSLRTWFGGFTPDGRLNMTDAVVNDWNDRRRQLGLRVYTRDIINHAIDRRVLESPFVNEALFPNRMRYWQGAYATGPGNTDALLWVSHTRPDSAPYGEAAPALLELLVPAFQAGLSALHRLDAARAALDVSGASLLVFDAEGRELYRSAALVKIVDGDPAGATLVSRARVLAARTAKDLVLHPGAGGRDPGPVAAEVTTPTGRYALRVSLLPEGAFGTGPSVVVLVTPRTPPSLPSSRSLEEEHGLTRREAQVALRIASGATLKEIAAALFISPHTARAHTEKVFRKLGVTTRAAVALAILQAPSVR